MEYQNRYTDICGEIRRIGREMFRTNRVAERNQEKLDEAISEIARQLASYFSFLQTLFDSKLESIFRQTSRKHLSNLPTDGVSPARIL
ncbi:MAG: hypothetical protein L0220_17120 [Acidobacteria bacterium]|nr:hypothetical protein [Acidobacteriota bacterium]